MKIDDRRLLLVMNEHKNTNEVIIIIIVGGVYINLSLSVSTGPYLCVLKKLRPHFVRWPAVDHEAAFLFSTQTSVNVVTIIVIHCWLHIIPV